MRHLKKYSGRSSLPMIWINPRIASVFSKPCSMLAFRHGECRGRLIVCFNKRAALEMQESRLDEVEAARVRLRKRLTIKPELREFFDQDGQLILRRVHAQRRWDGVSFIFTTSPFTIDDTIKAYFYKDVVEKSFQSLEGVVRL